MRIALKLVGAIVGSETTFDDFYTWSKSDNLDNYQMLEADIQACGE